MLAGDGQPLGVGPRATAVLGALLAADGRVVTEAELLDAGWPGLIVEEGKLSVQIAALRKALGTGPNGGEWIAAIARVGYRFAGPVTVEAEAATPGPAAPVPAEGRSAVAVLPFANPGGDPGDDHFADGITEAIISALSRFPWFHAIGRNASFALRSTGADASGIARALGARYVLQGRVRRAGRVVRISVNPVEAASAHQVWAERYDTELDDLFAGQDRIAAGLAAVQLDQRNPYAHYALAITSACGADVDRAVARAASAERGCARTDPAQQSRVGGAARSLARGGRPAVGSRSWEQ